MKQLRWGQTPWDELDRDALLREVQRMYSALSAVTKIVDMARTADPSSAYWQRSSAGGGALLKAHQVLDPIAEQYDAESLYRMFYRYADDLLFRREGGDMIGVGWAVCPVDGRMYGEWMDGTSHIGERCTDMLPTGCPGVLRALTWDDLRSAEDAGDDTETRE